MKKLLLITAVMFLVSAQTPPPLSPGESFCDLGLNTPQGQTSTTTPEIGTIIVTGYDKDGLNSIVIHFNGTMVKTCLSNNSTANVVCSADVSWIFVKGKHQNISAICTSKAQVGFVASTNTVSMNYPW